MKFQLNEVIKLKNAMLPNDPKYIIIGFRKFLWFKTMVHLRSVDGHRIEIWTDIKNILKWNEK